MTREEAIKIIEFIDTRYMTLETDERNALKMAIKALSQEPTFDDECQKDMDEAWEQIQKKRKRIPVTLDLTPCDDAISREAFIKRYDEWMYSEYGKHCEKDALAIRVANSLPSVTQKSGKWIKKGNTLKCPLCGAKGEDIKDDYCFNYCPNCGAKMESEG